MKTKVKVKRSSVGPLVVRAELTQKSAKCTISRGNKKTYSDCKLKESSNDK